MYMGLELAKQIKQSSHIDGDVGSTSPATHADDPTQPCFFKLFYFVFDCFIYFFILVHE